MSEERVRFEVLLEDILARMKALGEGYSALRTSLDGVHVALGDMRQRFDHLEMRFDVLGRELRASDEIQQKDIKELKIDVATLKTDVATLKRDGKTIKAEVKGSKAERKANRKRVAALERSGGNADQRITRIESHLHLNGPIRTIGHRKPTKRATKRTLKS